MWQQWCINSQRKKIHLNSRMHHPPSVLPNARSQLIHIFSDMSSSIWIIEVQSSGGWEYPHEPAMPLTHHKIINWIWIYPKQNYWYINWRILLGFHVMLFHPCYNYISRYIYIYIYLMQYIYIPNIVCCMLMRLSSWFIIANRCYHLCRGIIVISPM